MVNIVFINEKSVDQEDLKQLKSGFEQIFKFTQDVNIHLLLNFKSTVDTLGFYDIITFIEVPYRQGNYYRTYSKTYLNNIVFAYREIKDESIIDIKDGGLLTKEGSLDYNKMMEEEKSSLKRFLRDNFKEVKSFDFSLYYNISAPNCDKNGRYGNLFFNKTCNFKELIDETIDNLKGDRNSTICVSLCEHKPLSYFISSFLEMVEPRTSHGILTKKKMDAISTKEIGKQMQAVYDSSGEHLVIITGKPGTGKSLSLLRFMYNNVQNHHCRLLTFNNLLVMDTKLTIKNFGEFNPTNASITTLHKFFYDIYINTPVCDLHMDESQIDMLFDKCNKRVALMVVLIEKYAESNALNNNAIAILNYYIEKDNGHKYVPIEDKKEMFFFASYLSRQKEWGIGTLHQLAYEYVREKREKFIQLYGKQAFISGYRIIMEQLYLLFHYKDEFFETFGMDLCSASQSIRRSDEFEQKDHILYHDFLAKCKERFSEEHGIPEDCFTQYIAQQSKLKNDTALNIDKLREKQLVYNDKVVKAIRRKVKWSKYVLIDEGQDCAGYEKELLLELFGSNNIIVASGGKEQLIRTAIETRWDFSFDDKLDHQLINLTHISHRQKGNIVEFINAYAKEFSLETELKVPDSIKGEGRVIIDLRNDINQNNMPIDVMSNLKESGADHGCQPYESIMMLFPNEGYTTFSDGGDTVDIDINDTIDMEGKERERSLKVNLPNGKFDILDCTVNKKASLLRDVGQNKTRALLYESCRGLEAWSVMCFGLDTFFSEKQTSQSAIEYVDEATGLFKDDEDQRKLFLEKYCALWGLMAMTRAMDTLYISFANPNSRLATRISNIASSLPFVEILR